jgi:oxygen-independent coproporphyrinogen-3 oxidase
VEALEEAGYVPIGMDHFALPEDALARAAAAGTLWRNFMGYTVQRAPELVAVGMSGIGEVDGAFFQNRRNLRRYEDAVEASGLAVERGYVLGADDLLRREVIASLMCRFRVDFGAVEDEFRIDFAEHFAGELRSLAPMEADGLVRRLPRALEVLPEGRLLVRNVCMAFDAHLAARRRDRPVFSRTV